MHIRLPATRIASVLAILIVAGATACDVPMRSGADYDRDVDFDQFRTFAWEDSDPFPVGDPRLDNDPRFVERVQAAIEAELLARGIHRVDESPDLLVHFHASVRERVEVIQADREAGYDAGEHGAQVLQYEEGTLIVDVAEPATMRIIWRGWAQADVGAALDNPGRMEQLLQAAAREMFRHYPKATVVLN